MEAALHLFFAQSYGNLRDNAVQERFDNFFAAVRNTKQELDADAVQSLYLEFLDIVYLVPLYERIVGPTNQLYNLLQHLPSDVRPSVIECETFKLACYEYFLTRKVEYYENLREEHQAEAEAARGASVAVNQDVADGLIARETTIYNVVMGAVEITEVALEEVLEDLVHAQQECTSSFVLPSHSVAYGRWQRYTMQFTRKLFLRVTRQTAPLCPTTSTLVGCSTLVALVQKRSRVRRPNPRRTIA